MMKMVPSAAFKLDGLSDFTYTRLCRRSASRQARTLLSLDLFLGSVRILVEAEENRRSSSHPRTDVTHQLSALQGNARTDRFCRSFHSSRPRATATLLKRTRIRAFMYGAKLGVRAYVSQSAAITAASTNQNVRFIPLFLLLICLSRSLSLVIVRVRIHLQCDFAAFPNRIRLTCFTNLKNFSKLIQKYPGTDSSKHYS